MSLQREDVDKLLAPALVDGLGDVELAELRGRRDACKRVEDMVSYLRRVVQGQIDLVEAEVAQRAAGGSRGDVTALVENLAGILSGPAPAPAPAPGAGAGPGPDAGAGPGDASGTAPRTSAGDPRDGGRAGDSLATAQHRPVGAVHNMSALAEMFEEPSDLTPDEIAAALSPELAETLFPGGSLPGANLGSFTDAELVTLGEALRRQEHDLSEQRHTLHERIDLLQATIVDRYKSGAADVDSLLAEADAELASLADDMETTDVVVDDPGSDGIPDTGSPGSEP
jgi:hypothetical protein